MKQVFLISFLCILSLTGYGQNMVPNGNFEQYTSCPPTTNYIIYASGWDTYTSGSPDYYNGCGNGTYGGVPANTGGYQFAASGNAYAAFYNMTNVREHCQRAIIPLTIGATYEVSISVSLADSAGIATDGLGVFFYDAGPTFFNSYSIPPTTNPQISYTNYGVIFDKTNWVRLIDTFTADSAYDNIVIGGFLPNNLQNAIPVGTGFFAYYYLDSVVVKLASHVIFNFTDTLLCAGDTISVPYTVSPLGYFNSGNVFTLQLSDATGNFNSAINIGSIVSTSSGTMTGVIPVSVPTGTGYRLRISASNIIDTLSKSFRNIHIKPIAANLNASNNSPLCQDDTLHLLATSTSMGVSYSWTGPAGFLSTLQNPNRNTMVSSFAGEYIVTATLNGCKGRDTTIVIYKPIPAKPTVSSNTPVCPSTTLSLTANSSTSGVSYNWTGPASFSSNTQNPNISSVNTTHAGVYRVSVTLNGCTSAYDSTVVAVYITTPTPTGTSNSPICVGEQLNLFTPVLAGGGYEWHGPAGFSSASQNPSILGAGFNYAGAYTLTVTVNGCTSLPDTLNVIVNPSPQINIYPNPNDTICPGINVTFVAITSNAGSSVLYRWIKNNIPIGIASPTYLSPAITDKDVIICELTAAGVCASAYKDTSNAITMTVLPWLAPSVSITSNPATPLSPWQMVNFTATATNAGIKPNYQWKRNGQDIVGATSSVWGTQQLSDHDTICCVVTSSYMCAQPLSAISNCIEVQVLTGINDAGREKVHIYPNPVGNELVIEGAELNTTIQLFDLYGRVVLKGTVSQQKQAVNTSVLPAGTYVLQLTSANGERVIRKVMKQ